MKSYLALNMAYDLAEGTDVCGLWPVKGGPKRVLLIEQECGQDELQRRAGKIHAWRAGQWASENLWLVSKDLDCVLDTDHGMELIQKHVNKSQAQIVVFDPLSWFHSKNGNDNDDMKWLMRRMLKWQQEKNLASIMTHHCGKPSDWRSGNGTDINSIKGASAVQEAASSVCGISRPTASNTIIRLDFTFRHAPNPKRPVKLQFKEEGEAGEGTFELMP